MGRRLSQTGHETEDRPLVAFDFDGTITVRDSYTAFLKWRAGPARYAAGMARLGPAALSYFGHRDRGIIKAEATREFLKGVPRETLIAEAKRFAAEHAARLFRPDAVATFQDWKKKGAEVVIVTASPDVIVRPFAEMLGADDLLGTQLAVDESDRITGAFACLNCRGMEKVLRLRAAYGEDVRLAAAYGDTSGDTEMLQIAAQPGYRVFTGRP